MAMDDTRLDRWRELALQLEREVGTVVVGQNRIIRLLTVAVFARGHVLLQGDVGVGKTTLLRAFAHVIGGAYARIEGSIDLMPSDLVYYTFIGADGRPQVEPGPLLRHGDALSIFFFNEINRARPQVHALLLRVMAEQSVAAFNREYRFPHLQVFADRNRLEREETFEISSAARDRFMMEIAVDTPDDDDLRRELAFSPRFHDVDRLVAQLPPAILSHREIGTVAAAIQDRVQASDALQRYVLELWRATGDPVRFGVEVDDCDMQRLMLAGASPRGMSMMLRAARVAAWLQGRDYVAPEDVQQVFAPAIGHRLCLQPIYELRRSEIIGQLLRRIGERVSAP
jgi:MoxR-like ATPase